MESNTIYLLGTFTLKDECKPNRYLLDKKCIYFIANNVKDTIAFIKEHYLDSNGGYEFDITPCREEDLKGHYWTDGFQSIVRVGEDNVIGKMDVRQREFLVEWESREHNGEYARVLRRKNFIVTDNDYKNAGVRANTFAIRMRYAYSDDYTFYTTTDNEKELEEVKKSGDFVVVRD